MVVVMKNECNNKTFIVRTGWDVRRESVKNDGYYEDYGQKFEEAFLKECERREIDPDICGCSIEDLATGLGDPVIEARKLVYRTMRRLRLI
jgi:hypothetical protein